ncbi:MAG: site-2 protease family protein [Thermoanaerobaculaceae bacterium]|nr:site-2 protease family protein [Thermoanaerobaculaceae bacterium]MDI9621563.1 site-2 protease family protein [Acidobacteriota bacterium]NLH11556.1 CBS domain-containing protein [Holophagae bacterium]HPW55191.1 site-2 protease family protein [Thermoanaerobaculaceae bacterium]
MSWSLRFARVSGIDIKVHLTFVLILVLGALQWGRPHGPIGALFGVLLMLALFACVTLHELGHALVAQRFHVPVREIVLLPLGGVAVLGKNPDRPLHELLIAGAGPAVNVVIAAVLLPVTGVAVSWSGLDPQQLVSGAAGPSLSTFLVWMLQANVMLVLFNLIPAFPLDGGRILRALLTMGMGYARATRIVTGIGQLFAFGLGLLGVASGNFLLVLVAVFVFFGAGIESAHAQAKSVLSTLRVGEAYNKHAITLVPADRASRVVDYILTSYQPDFAVLQGGRLLGVVTRDDLLRSLASSADDAYVTGIMQREVVRVEATMSLDEVLARMDETSSRIVAVQEGGRYLGLVSREDLAEAMTVVAFLQRQRVLQQRAA